MWIVWLYTTDERMKGIQDLRLAQLLPAAEPYTEYEFC